MGQTIRTPPAALFVADNLALDFINTRYGTEPDVQDVITDDKSVLDWLRVTGLLPSAIQEAPQGLLALALTLRESAKAAVEAAQKGVPVEVSGINAVLKQGRPVRVLAWDDQRAGFRVDQHRSQYDAAGLLAPIAESLAELLTSKRFVHVKQCEAHDCILLFLDQTKSYRRRWCSMATCGNRMKVAAFRARKKDT